MGVFDHLIEKGKEPKVGTEYIYNIDMMWIDGQLGHVDIERGAIVTDVVQRENGSYEFTVPGREGRYQCNYPWAFIENTLENSEMYDRILEIEREVEKLNGERQDIINEISLDRKKLTYEERISWFIQNFYETGMEYPILLENMKDKDLDNFKWYDDIINIPKYKDEI